MTTGQQKELIAVVIKAIPSISEQDADYWLQHKAELAARIRRAIQRDTEDTRFTLAEVRKFYHDLPIARPKYPVERPGIDRAIDRAWENLGASRHE